MKLLFLILTIFIVAVCCERPTAGLSDRPCPERPFANSFDVSRIAGKWYGIRGYPSPFYQGLSCYSDNHVVTGANTYNLTFCEKFNGVNSCSGVVVDHANQDGRANFNIEGQFVGIGYYLYVDYDNYYISYNCQNLDYNQSQTSLWIASRAPTLSDELLEEALEKIKKYFAVNALKKIDQNKNLCDPRPSF